MKFILIIASCLLSTSAWSQTTTVSVATHLMGRTTVYICKSTVDSSFVDLIIKESGSGIVALLNNVNVPFQLEEDPAGSGDIYFRPTGVPAGSPESEYFCKYQSTSATYCT